MPRRANRIFSAGVSSGALLYLGDVHASQGDTEFTGTAARNQIDGRARLEVIKEKRSPDAGSRNRIDCRAVRIRARLRWRWKRRRST